MVWFIILLAPLAAGLVVWRTPETIAPEPPGQQFRLRDYVELIIRPSMARILAADLCLSLGPGWMSALFLFFSRDRMGFTTGQANMLLAIYILAGLAGAPGMAWLATKIGKHRAVILATTIYSLTLFSLAFLPRDNVAASTPTMFLTGFLAAGFNVLTRAMTADVADEIRLEQGKERSGLLYALTTLTTKIALAVSIVLTFSVLGRVGYDPKIGHGNAPEAITGLMLTFISGPIVFVMLGACLLGYKLTAERAADVCRQLDERDALYGAATGIAGITAEPGEVAPSRS
jgi:GPH family glycoside/pentoside/hexuronide:cation symporter